MPSRSKSRVDDSLAIFDDGLNPASFISKEASLCVPPSTVKIVGNLYNMAKKGGPINAHSFEELLGSARLELSRMSPSQLSQVVWAIAKVGSKNEVAKCLIDDVFKVSCDKMEKCTCNPLSQLVWGLGKLKRSDLLLQVKLQCRVVVLAPSFSARELATVIYGYASVYNIALDSCASLLEKLVPFVKLIAKKMNGQELANIAWAFATTRLLVPDFFDAIAVHIMKEVPNMKTQELSNTLWAFATLNVRNQALIDAIGAEMNKKADSMNGQELANTVWSYATLHVNTACCWDSISTQVKVKSHSMSSQNLSNTAWAYATMDIYNKDVLDSIAAQVVLRAKEMNGQAIANTAFAFATLKENNAAVFDALGTQVTFKSASMKCQELANVIWAFATVGNYNSSVCAAVAAVVPAKIKDMSTQNLANIAWAYGSLGVLNKAVFDSIGLQVKTRAGDMKNQELSNLVWAYASLRVYNEDVFDSIAPVVAVKACSLAAQDLSNIMWSYATMGLYYPSVTESVAKQVPVKLNSLSSQNLANLAWSYAVLDPYHLTALLSELAPKLLRSSFNAIEMNQVAQALVEARLSGALEECMLLQLENRFKMEVNAKVSSSKMHKDIMKVLTNTLGLEVQSEFLTELGYVVDVKMGGLWCDVDGSLRPLCIEVDGPSHFYVNSNYMTSVTAMKHRHLRGAGWIVISIPYWEWDSARARGDTIHYLMNMLGMCDYASANALSPTGPGSEMKVDCFA